MWKVASIILLTDFFIIKYLSVFTFFFFFNSQTVKIMFIIDIERGRNDKEKD